MADPWHVKWLKEGRERWNLRRKEVAFKPDLSGVDFSELLPDQESAGIFFDQIDLKYADLTGAKLKNLSFNNAQFYRAKLSNALLDHSSFERAKFNQADLRNVSAQSCNFTGAELRGAVLTEARLDKSIADFSDFRRSNLTEKQARTLNSYLGMLIPEQMDIQKKWDKTAIIEVHSLTEIDVGLFAKKVLSPALRIISSSRGIGDDEKNGRSVNLYYGTNRNPIYRSGRHVGYGAQRKESLEYGVCRVVIPKGHQIGSIGSPIWRRLRKGDDRIKLSELIQLNREIFWRHVQRNLIEKSKTNEPTLFIHGYNQSFSDAAVRAAQIGYDLGMGGGIALFSWPSAGRHLAYSADEAAMEASKFLLADFIEEFISQTNATKLNIIAHSMGCRCFLLAVEVLSARQSSSLGKIGQAILAAADVDQGIMKKLGTPVVQAADRTTNYVSGTDRAIQLSKWLHSYPRVGFAPPTYVMQSMDTVVVNNADLVSLGHGYISSNREVLSDIFDLIQNRLPPTKRFSLRQTSGADGAYWKFKE